MAFPLINPSHQWVDTSGAPLVSGTMEFRNPTSNALINSYPTADDADAQTNANANPFTLDSRGGFTGIYLEDGVKYKIILKDSLGVTIDTQDDVQCPGTTPFVQLRDFATAGDGTTDDATEIQAAIDSLETSGGTLLGHPADNYFFSTNLIFPTGVNLDGQGCTFTADATTFTLVKVGSNPAGVITNKNRFSFGSTPDVVHFKNFTLDCGIQELSSGIMFSNTNGSTIDNVRVITTAGTSMSALVDLDGQNTNTRVTRCRLEQIQGAGTSGACIAVRNPNQSIVSEGIVVRDNYLYKVGPSNTDELMWMNGAGGNTRNVKVVNNTFKQGATDTTSSAITAYRFTNSGAIPNALLSNVEITNNYFDCELSTFACILLGFTGDTTGTPPTDIKVVGNTIKMKAGAGIAAASDISDILIADNSITNTNSDSTVLTAVSLSTWPDQPAVVSNNRFYGKISTGVIGFADVTNNYATNCLIFADGPNSVRANNANCRQLGVVASSDCEVSDNVFKMTEYSGAAGHSGLHYVYYITGADVGTTIKDNVNIIYDPRIGILRASAALTPFVRFNNNISTDKLFAVTGAVDNGSGLIRLTVTAHQITTGKEIVVADVGGTTEANSTVANPSWTATSVDANTIDLQGSTFSNAYTSGGTIYGINTGFQTFSTAFLDLHDNSFNGLNTRRNSYVTAQPSGLTLNVEEALSTLDDTGTPTVRGGHIFKTGGTTAVTDFDDGVVGQTIQIISAHSVTITDGAPVILAGGANYTMVATDTLTLTMFDDQVWQEVSRSVN